MGDPQSPQTFDFHPAVWSWFRDKFGEPSEPQQEGWPAIRDGQNVLISSPTGSGKTLAAFSCAIDGLVKRAAAGNLGDQTRVLYVSPLKALANDIQKNLLDPLAGIATKARELNIELPEIRPLVRTGDTAASERRGMIRRPPHILVTTPESLFILLTSETGRTILETVRTVIVDEIHALARDKRGSHLSLSLERLEYLAGRELHRIGLSATQKPLERVARFLTGAHRKCRIVNIGHLRPLEVRVEVPSDELGAVASNEMWEELYDRISALTENFRTILVFVNTRRLVERVAHNLGDRLGKTEVAAHHGSLSKEVRLSVEERLKKGDLPVVVATASLELGIDIGSIDLVCQIGPTRSIALGLQRIGRSGHWKGAIPMGRFFALTRDELLECAALVRAIRQGDLDQVEVPVAPIDILAQQIVAAAASSEWLEDELFEVCRQAAPYSQLPRERFDRLVTMLSEGISTRRGRRAALLYRDRVNGKIRARRGAGLKAMTSGGAIPDGADFLVKVDPDDILVGRIDEDFAVESMRGDIFLLGNTSWRIRKVESGTVRVEDAQGAPPNVPFWRGEAPARSQELSQTLSSIRTKIADQKPIEAIRWLQQNCGLNRLGAEQAVEYITSGKTALGALPTQDCVVAERFFDESGGMQLILHAPFGGRINKAWGLALRKRFCRSFNFELQAAATENGILISLSEQHSFPLDSIFSFLSTRTVREVLKQAVLGVPLCTTRWRWNVARSLAVLRFMGGRRVPPPLQRMRSDDLLASVFPDQAACQENLSGEISIPDHPLVNQTLRDCLTEALDIDGLTRVLSRIEGQKIHCHAIDTREPSPFSAEILNANPFAFLDDAPLEERRARAVHARRSMLPEEAAELGRLDGQAIEQVIEEAQPRVESPDELHDALLTTGILPAREISAHGNLLEELQKDNRVVRLLVETIDPDTAPSPGDGGGPGEDSGHQTVYWAARERALLLRTAYPKARFRPKMDASEMARVALSRDGNLDSRQASIELLRCRLEYSGPVTATQLAALYQFPQQQVETALLGLEAEGQVLRGNFRPSVREMEWCDRRLLARIHRLTLGRLRKEIEPVSATDFVRFLCRWQQVEPGTQLHGEPGLRLVLDQLQGYEAPAAAWEGFLLPARVTDYKPELLDRLCLSGRFLWGRMHPPDSGSALRLASSSDGSDRGQSRHPADPGRSHSFFPTLRAGPLSNGTAGGRRPPGARPAASPPLPSRYRSARIPGSSRCLFPGRSSAGYGAAAG